LNGPSKGTGRIAQLDGLRGIAIAAVLIHHAYHVKLLWMGVDLFFVLSGFLVTGILERQKNKPFGNYIGHFYERRARRILPPYFVIMGVTSIVFGLGWLHYWYLYLGGMNFFHPLGIPSPETLPLWSLAVEEQFYLIWPLAIFFLSRKHVIRLNWLLLIAAPALRYFCTPLFSSEWAVYMLLPFRMDTLAAGALLALYWGDISKRLEALPAFRPQLIAACSSFAILSLSGVLICAKLGITTSSNVPLGNLWIYECTLCIAVAAFVLSMVKVGYRVLTSWPLVWLGRVSYSIYLVHLTALYLFPRSVILAVAATIAYALVLWFTVEKPMLRAPAPRLEQAQLS